MLAASSIQRLVIVLLGAVLLGLVGYYGIRKLAHNFEVNLLKHKVVRDTTATVIGKKHVQFDELNHSYLHDDGYRVERQPGDEEWRIYYQIDNFDQISEPERTRLLVAEKERAEKGKPRYDIASKEAYDGIKEGDKLDIGWQWVNDNKIIIAFASKRIQQKLP